MIDDFLYDNPDLYEKVFPPRGKSDLCIRFFEQYLPHPPSSVLDIGCGTGRDLADLATVYPGCVGFDVAPSMVAYAQRNNPTLEFHVGDMRSHRLGRTFDAICALGGCINFALSEEELEATVRTYQSHAHEGTLLLLQPMNPFDYFGEIKVPSSFSVPYKNSIAVGTATYELDTQKQVIHRRRSWKVQGQDIAFDDSMSYRIFFPSEIRYLLKLHGFEVLDIIQGAGSAAYANLSLYVIARFTGR